MSRLPIKRVVFAGALFFLWNSAGQTVKLQPLSRMQLTELKPRLDPILLPDHASSPLPETGQSFRVTSQFGKSYSVVPVRFDIEAPSIVKGITNSIRDCGVYIVPEERTGSVQFLWTVGKDPETAGAIQCTKTIAVGAEAVASGQPTLLFVEEVNKIHESYRQPLVVQWDDSHARYEINEALSAAAENVPEPLTIQNIKRQLFRKQ